MTVTRNNILGFMVYFDQFVSSIREPSEKVHFLWNKERASKQVVQIYIPMYFFPSPHPIFLAIRLDQDLTVAIHLSPEPKPQTLTSPEISPKVEKELARG